MKGEWWLVIICNYDDSLISDGFNSILKQTQVEERVVDQEITKHHLGALGHTT